MNVNSKEQLYRTVWYNAQKFETGLLAVSPVQGVYLLKNGTKSASPVYDQEAGIFIDENRCIPLKFSTKQLTYHEAELYYQSIGEEMPNLYDLIRLLVARRAVNQALENIGMADFKFSENVLSEIWYNNAPDNACSNSKRRCLVIKRCGNYKVPEYRVLEKKYFLHNQTNLYRLNDNSVEALPLTLEFNWSGIDFLTAESNKSTIYLYRDDKKLSFIGKDIYISIESDDVIVIDNKYYQYINGEFLPLYHYDIYCSYNKVNENEFYIYENGRYDEQLNGSAPDTKTRFRKGEDGIYRQIDQTVLEY